MSKVSCKSMLECGVLVLGLKGIGYIVSIVRIVEQLTLVQIVKRFCKTCKINIKQILTAT